MKFDLDKTKYLKGFAILLVLISHFYRYADTESIFSFLGHIGFFGAALFSFLSGYGLYASYEKKGIYSGWLVKKILNVYIPFIIITVISDMFVYKSNLLKFKNILGIFYGKNDQTMWFVPWIMLFYILFYFIFKYLKSEKNKLTILIVIILLITINLQLNQNVNSVWYTCNASLVGGVFFRKISLKTNKVGLVSLYSIFFILLYISLKFRGNIFIKDYATLFDGLFFCLATCYTVVVVKNFLLVYNKTKLLAFIGKYAYYIYIIQAKILLFFLFKPQYKLLFFVIITILCAYIFRNLYENGKKMLIKSFIRRRYDEEVQ